MSYPWHPFFSYPWNDTEELCKLFSWTAWKTWWDLCDSKRLGLSISEESITDMLLLDMLRRTNRIACKKFTRSEEKKSGADWQWWFISGNQGFPMLIQAKRLYSRSDRYEKLGYNNQTKTLLRTACDYDCLPLFCFYNYWNSPLLPQNPDWGCALASAQSVKNLLLHSGPKGNRIDSIKPISVPWSSLVCSIDHSGIDFPNAVRRRVMQIPDFRHRTVPEVRDLPPDVHQLLSKARDEDGQMHPNFLEPFEDQSTAPRDRSSIAGIIVVSNQPIERKG